MKRTLLEEIDRMHHIKNYIDLIPKTIERDYNDMTDMRNHPPKTFKYKGYTIEEDWLGFFSVGGYITNDIEKMYKFIDKKIEEKSEPEEFGEE